MEISNVKLAKDGRSVLFQIPDIKPANPKVKMNLNLQWAPVQKSSMNWFTSPSTKSQKKINHVIFFSLFSVSFFFSADAGLAIRGRFMVLKNNNYTRR
ncbi:MAG: hypothetical protein CM1200mP29_10310 [Verrucomicrobiota bacterium]|nr:MAG: hypothetical protein CM1200mP29_10310 [Verrucomicrobiota bacterium]